MQAEPVEPLRRARDVACYAHKQCYGQPVTYLEGVFVHVGEFLARSCQDGLQQVLELVRCGLGLWWGCTRTMDSSASMQPGHCILVGWPVLVQAVQMA